MHLGTWSLTLNLGGFERAADISDCRIVAEDMPAEERHLCGPITRYRLKAVAAQDLSADSIWTLAWDYAHQLVDVELRPAGGDAPSEDTPWFVGTVRIPEPRGDVLGGTANASRTAKFTFEIDWPFEAKPERVTS